MRKRLPALFQRSFFLMIALLGGVVKMQAQIDITIGTGTATNTSTTYPTPLQDFYEGSRAQYIYRASELQAAGMAPGFISAIKFNVVGLNPNTTPGNPAIENLTFKIGFTSQTALNPTTWETVTQVYTNAAYTPTLGLNTFTFTPVFWNGTDNIVVESCNGDPTNTTATTWTGNTLVAWTAGLPFIASHLYRADGEGNLCGTASVTPPGFSDDPNARPNIVFTYTPAAACSGAPVGGTAATNPASICTGQTFTLSITGSTVASGLTYQWESSTTGAAPWTPIAGATQPTYTGTQLATTWYRRVTTCSGSSTPSSSVQVIFQNPVQGVYRIGTAASGAPFQTLNQAYDFIKCGISGDVTFNVDAGYGPFTEQLIMGPIQRTVPTAHVIWNGNGASINFTSTNTNERAVIKLDGTDWQTFNDFVINPGGTTTTNYGYGVQLMNDADSNVINNCTINLNITSTSTQYAGIVMSSSASSATTTGSTLCDANIFSNNTINGGYYGITLVGSSTDAVMNNKVIRNNIKDFYLYGIYISGNFSTQIDSNTVSRPNRTAPSDYYGVYSTGLSTRVNITRNTFTNPFGAAPTNTNVFYGIYFTGTDALGLLENKVVNNLIWGLTGSGNVYGIYNASSDNIFYYHNTIVLDGSPATSSASNFARGFYQTTSAAGIEFKNNIVAITRNGSATKHAIYFNTTASTIISDRNDFYVNAPAGANYIGAYGATNAATLPAWRSASSQDANSITANPVFVDPINGNFKPTSSAVNGLGEALGITNDILGAPRNMTNPDMGAYEFEPLPCTTPPVAGTTVVSPTTVCANFPISATLTGNSTGLTQTYHWEASTAGAGGPFTPIGNNLTNPDTTIIATTTMWYRVAVTCSGITSYSTPAQVIVNPALPQGTYTINPAGGTALPNFISFNAAKAAMACGIAGDVTFNVTNTTYNEQLILDSIPGTDNYTITFNGNGATLTFLSTNTAERATLKFNGVDNTTFRNLNIVAQGTSTTEYGFGVQFINGSDKNRVVSSNITVAANTTSTNYAGVVMSNSATSATTTGATNTDFNKIDSCTISGGYYGVTLIGADATPVNNNEVTNNTIKNFYTYGVYVTANRNGLVDKNDISRPNHTSLTTFYGVYMSGASINTRVTRNRIHDNSNTNTTSTSTFYGVYMTGVDAIAGQENVIANNAIYNVNSDGDVYGIYNTSSDYALYYHNTIALDYALSAHTDFWWTRAIYQTGTASGIKVMNNMITIRRTGEGDRHGLYYATSANSIESNNNNVYVVKTGSGVAAYGYSGGDQVTLANWQAATSQDAASLSLDPLYTNPTATPADFTPRMPVLDNKGTAVGITNDINGVVRSATTPDIGAFEFTIPPCVTPPTPGVAAAFPNTGICMGTMIALSVSGQTTGAGQTYQWQTSPTNGPTWTNLGNPMMFPDTTVMSTTTLYYRLAVTCSGQTAYSTPALVTLNPAFLGGVYTIGGASPDFPNFTSAVAALECGVTDNVFFKVRPGTYTEQVRMKYIAGTGFIPALGRTVRVSFEAENGTPSSVTLTAAGTAAANYTLMLDSAQFITWKNLTVANTSTTNGRVIALANTAANDSFYNLTINPAAMTTSTTNVAGIFGDLLRGGNHEIRKNTITNGSYGIYLQGSNNAFTTRNNIIDSNTIVNPSAYGMYVSNQWRARVSNNSVTRTNPMAATSYGIYMNNVDTMYWVLRNNVNITTSTTGTIYGMYITGCDGLFNDSARVNANTISVVSTSTTSLYGLYVSTSNNNFTTNNSISVSTTGTTSNGLYSTGGGNNRYWNNSVNNYSTTGTLSNAAYFANTGAPVDIRNNIFAHQTVGRAMEVTSSNGIYSDYNMLYTGGTTLVRFGATNYAALNNWQNGQYWDINSIVFKPAFLANNNLRPDVAAPEVWAMHGRGTQILNNWFDFDGNYRPQAFREGVPDMGAYEFLPTSTPPALSGTPSAVPGAGNMQTFMFGTDTVAKVTYAPTGAVPTSIVVRRYSGVLPAGVDQVTTRSMYFYNKVEITGSQPANYKLDQFYIDPWLGFIGGEDSIRLGRTDAANAWNVELRSTVNTTANVMTRDSLSYMDRFTGLTNGQVTVPTPPQFTTQVDSSNRGKRFWVAYQRSYDFFAGSNSQNMVIYLSTDAQPANVTVKIKGTNWSRTYAIPANTAISTEALPKSGLIDARLLQEGFYSRGISIESDVNITAYAHIYSNSNSGATMLLPVGTYGYEYYTLNSRQNYSTTDAYSSFYVVADKNNTKVQITPSAPTLAGRAANVPFEVTLNAGDVYQVLGAMISGAEGYDLTGSTVRAVPNSEGKCWPMAVFAGSTRTSIGCGANFSGSGDVIMQQIFPYQAWGTRYLTAPTSGDVASTLMTNVYRIMVKDPATVVSVNGTPLVGPPINGRYYQLESNTGDVITANKPIMVAQYMASSGLCANTNDGDPEMFYLSPVQQAVKYSAFYRNNLSFIDENYMTIVIPTNGLNSLYIDGTLVGAAGSGADYVYAHPNAAGYSVVVKRWGSTAGQSVVYSDSSFTGIVYGLGSVESYGYNVGTLVKNLNGIPAISNTLSSNPGPSSYTCAGAPFQFRIQVPLKPTQINWQFANVPALNPNANVLDNNPIPSDSAMINGQMYYTYVVPVNFTVNTPGTYLIPISFVHPEIEGCNNTLETTYPLTVLATPTLDFNTASFTVCPNVPITFTGTGSTVNGTPITTWSYNINTTPAFTANTQNTIATFTTPGTYNIQFRGISVDGCPAEITKPITVAQLPTVATTVDTIGICQGSGSIVFNVSSPQAGVTYNWYDAATGGNLVATGPSFTAPTPTGTNNYYVEATNGSCNSVRKRVTAIVSAVPNFTLASDSVAVCAGGLSTFTVQAPQAGVTYSWYTTLTGGTPVANGTSYTAPSQVGSQYFYVQASLNGCTTNPRQKVIAYQTVVPAFTLVRDTVSVCAGTPAVFTVSNPAAGAIYNWYPAVTGGTPIGTGTNFTAPAAGGQVTYYVDATLNGCTSTPRKALVAKQAGPLATPVATPDEITQNSIRFKWNAVPGATAYEVSRDNGTTWSTPTSGALGLTHTINGLLPTQTVTLLVRALGTNSCETSANGTVTATTLVGTWYIPTAFSPGTTNNGPAENNQLRIYPNQNTGIGQLKFMVFDQWGNKLNESTDPRMLWDGTYKGKAQPSGVYMYVCHIVMLDGRVFDLKGSINLIR